MTCICDDGVNIGVCSPYANRDDVLAALLELCKDCYGEVDADVDEVDFCDEAFSGAYDECCDFLIVKRGTAPDEEYFISKDCTNWYKITESFPWIEVPGGTLQEDFIAQGWGAVADLPDDFYNPVLYVIEGCNIWMGVNDPVACDLGSVPSVPGTGTDWKLVGALDDYPNKYLRGLEVDIDNNVLTGTIYTGECRDDTDTVNIDVVAPLAFNAGVVGANGLDAGAVALNTWYYVYVIRGAFGVASLISTSAAPVMPPGYTYKRRVGWARCGADTLFEGNYMRSDRVMWDRGYIALLTNANITGAYVNYSAAAWVPPTGRYGFFTLRVSPDGGNGDIAWRDGTTLLQDIHYVLGSGGGNEINGNQAGPLPLDTNQTFEIMELGGGAGDEDLTLHIYGYVDDRNQYTTAF